jgi:hypothetical protein
MPWEYRTYPIPTVQKVIVEYGNAALQGAEYKARMAKWAPTGARFLMAGQTLGPGAPPMPHVLFASITEETTGSGLPRWRWCGTRRFAEQTWRIMLDMKVNDYNGAKRGPGNLITSGEVLSGILDELFRTPSALDELSALGIHNPRFRDEREGGTFAAGGAMFENPFSLVVDTGVYVDPLPGMAGPAGVVHPEGDTSPVTSPDDNMPDVKLDEEGEEIPAPDKTTGVSGLPLPEPLPIPKSVPRRKR